MAMLYFPINLDSGNNDGERLALRDSTFTKPIWNSEYIQWAVLMIRNPLLGSFNNDLEPTHFYNVLATYGIWTWQDKDSNWSAGHDRCIFSIQTVGGSQRWHYWRTGVCRLSVFFQGEGEKTSSAEDAVDVILRELSEFSREFDDT